MIKRNISHWIGFAMLFAVISFFFYKSIFVELPLNETLHTIEDIQDKQVRLHRDLLRYRSNQIDGYDTLNNTLDELTENIDHLNESKTAIDTIGISMLGNLKTQIENESMLVEDFKTHHSILQNSLSYIFNLSADLYATKRSDGPEKMDRIKAELITLLLEYNENAENNIANKIYPLIDTLNVTPDTDTNALINHSLMIIERLPEIDTILARFNSLNVENHIINLKNTITDLRDKQNINSKMFNILLFISTIYLVFYIMYIVISLRKNKDELSDSNIRLNDEIKLREKTEQALYQLVNIDRCISNDEDRILFLLNALCEAVDAEYAYIGKLNRTGEYTEILGLLDHGMFTKDFVFKVEDTPCDDVIKNGRLVYNRDFAEYYPDCNKKLLHRAVSYVGIGLTDKKDNVIGLIAIASESPIKDTNLAENILTIASSRAINELEHQVELNNSRRYQQGLSLIDDWIARLITEDYDEAAFFRNICLAAQEIIKAQLAAFPALHSNKEEYSFLSATGNQSELLKDVTLNIKDDGLCAQVILSNKNFMSNDITTDPGIHLQFSPDINIKSALLTPVALKDEPYGAIAVFRSSNVTGHNDDFDHVDEQLMMQFSQSVQMAIINMQLVSDIKTERERAEVTLHSIGDAVITTNARGKIEYMNCVAESLTSWSLEEAKNRDVKEVFRIEDMDTGEPIHDIIESCMDENITIHKSILALIDKIGNRKDIESSISPILNTSKQTEGVVIVFHDETQRRQLENTIKHQASHDSLTGLLNRDAFDGELNDHVFAATSSDKSHALCYLDLDRFKLINDTAGHTAGDQCLIQVTSLIQSCIRSDDVLGRLGGDEFGLILQNCNHESALKIARGITKAISEMAFKWDGCDYKLGVSIGINPLNKVTRDATDAIRKADLACYTAKDRGRSQVYVYQDEDSELMKRQEETYWATRISETIENNRICLYAQPIVSLRDKQPQNKHVEILVRLIDEDNKIVPPNAFIPAAERYNLMNLLDRKIVLDTFHFIHKYADQDKVNTHYSINLSGNTLDDEDIVAYITDLAEQYEIDTNTICFEITETTAIKNLQTAKAFIKELKAIGFKFALDDFGSGLSSFQYLKNLPVDYLKIDGSFVADMVNNNIDHAMVAAINEVGHTMGIETIAEYVENDQIIKKLQQIEVDYGQGYGIEQPKPLLELMGFEDKEKSPSLKIVHNKP